MSNDDYQQSTDGGAVFAARNRANLVRRRTIYAGVAAVMVTGLVPSASAGGRPDVGPELIAMKWGPVLPGLAAGNTGGQFSKEQIQRLRCETSGDPHLAVDISCNIPDLGQDYSPDNELTVTVNPHHPDHVVAGSNDYFYRFNDSTGIPQLVVPTGFFTSFDGGSTWVDGQIPLRTGNSGGDPAPAFVGAFSDPDDPHRGVVLMAQLEHTVGHGGFFPAQGDVAVSRSTDGGITWSEPVTVMQGTGAGPAAQSIFFDKEWLAVDNHPNSPFYGRAYLVAARFLASVQGRYTESPIFLSYSDDGGQTWSPPREISGSHPTCTFQLAGPGRECDEDQFAIPVVAADGTLVVHFLNWQNEAEWEQEFDADARIMVVRSADGGESFSGPVSVVDLEDGLADMPFSVVRRQTVWGHQLRWTAAGNIAADPTDADHLTVVFADRGRPNPNAPEGCTLAVATPPRYDPCRAGPGTDLDVFRVDSYDGGQTWGPRTLLDDAGGRSQWFVWSAYRPDGSFVAAWDEDTAAAAADSFVHVLWDSTAGRQILSPTPEQVDVALTHWVGEIRQPSGWPTVCGPASYTDPPVTNAEGKDCGWFHGDYTGLAVGVDGSVHIVWTGFNRLTQSPQIDQHTGAFHDGYAEDAMYARR